MALLRTWAALGAAVVLSGCGALFYQPTSNRYTIPERFDVNWQDHSIPRPGGGILQAALIRKKDAEASRGLIIQFHGNAQNLTAHWLSMRWAVQRNWSLLAWDYSGYGASDGTPDPDQIATDADAFLAWVSDSVLPSQTGPVVVVGQSLGSAILLRAFPRWKDRDKVVLVVSEGGFARYRDMGFDVATRHWLLYPLYPLVPLLISNAQSPDKTIPSIAPTPLLIVSCTEDKAVPTRHQHWIHELAKGSLFWKVDGCPHINAFRADSIRTRFANLVDSLALGHR
ncbi:MAG: alpha/beta hydrolase [Fibrobacteres bacterium]|jgi:pimeloyl-ACP methyl ester carboxylesterase|nr:alpha/beta hydrolase [Fibrobacterota bacterium]